MHLSMSCRRGGEAGHGVGIWLSLLALGLGIWLILFSLGRGYLNLSSPDVEIFDCQLGRKRLRPNILFPASTFHACAVRSGKIWKSWKPTGTSESWVYFTVLSSNFVCFSVFLSFDQLNLLRYFGIKVNGSKEKQSRFLQVQLVKLTFFVPLIY